MLTLPELAPCPYHPDEPAKPIADCGVCWERFMLDFKYGPHIRRINAALDLYQFRVMRAQQYIALRADGFETNAVPPMDTPVVFALPDGSRTEGRRIPDLMDGGYEVRDTPELTPISAYLGWKLG